MRTPLVSVVREAPAASRHAFRIDAPRKHAAEIEGSGDSEADQNRADHCKHHARAESPSLG